MNIKRFFQHVACSRNYIAGSALTLVLAIAGGPAESTEATTVPSLHDAPTEVSRAQDSQVASPSRINGRADWDTDYPSQLAPEGVPLLPARKESVGVASPAQAVRGSLSSQSPSVSTHPSP